MNPETLRHENGRLHVSASAFNDRNKQPSVDRSLLKANPRLSKKDFACKVLEISCARIRRIDIEVTDKALREDNIGRYAVDVFPRPLTERPVNLAHAQIEASPVMTNSRFEKLKESLARIAEAECRVFE